MDLYPRAVELRLDGDPIPLLEGVHGGPGLRQHRFDWPPDRQPNVLEPRLPRLTCRFGDETNVVRDLYRPLDGVDGDTEGLGGRVPDRPLADPDPHGAYHESGEKPGLGRIGPVEQPEQRIEFGVRAAGAVGRGEPAEGSIDAGDGEPAIAPAAERPEAALPAECQPFGDRSDLADRSQPVFDVGRRHVRFGRLRERRMTQCRPDVEFRRAVSREHPALDEPGHGVEVLAGTDEQIRHEFDGFRIRGDVLDCCGPIGERRELHGHVCRIPVDSD